MAGGRNPLKHSGASPSLEFELYQPLILAFQMEGSPLFTRETVQNATHQGSVKEVAVFFRFRRRGREQSRGHMTSR